MTILRSYISRDLSLGGGLRKINFNLKKNSKVEFLSISYRKITVILY